ncbi:hypothetical protein [Bacillus phage Nachito]|nr:hypothetical protein [Bacillus phage Nachito]
MKSGFHTIKVALAPYKEQPPVYDNPLKFNFQGNQPVSPSVPSPSEIIQPDTPAPEIRIPEAQPEPEIEIDTTEIIVDPTPHVTIPSGFLNEHGIHNIKDVAETDGGIINSIFAPVGQAFLDGFHWLFIKTLEVSPLALTTVGLCCFILTIAWGKGKPYMWGMLAWALSAIIRVISHEFK